MAAVSDLGMFKIFFPGSQSDLTGVEEGEEEEGEEIRDTLEKETSKKVFSSPLLSSRLFLGNGYASNLLLLCF